MKSMGEDMGTLDSDLLRTFLAVVDAGSVTGGAVTALRSQSAVSVQIKKLEGLVGQPVFERHGRGVVLSPAGEALEPAARKIVRELDSTLADVSGSGLEGTLRIGIPDDHSRGTLSRIVAEFSRHHPKVELVVQCALSAGFPRALATGGLDLAVHEVEDLEPGMDLLREYDMLWVASRGHDAQLRDPLPVAVFDRACWWREIALKALRASGRPFRVVYTSESVPGVAAAIRAGIAVGVLNASALTDDLVALGAREGFGPIPSSKLVLQSARNGGGPVSQAMASAIRRAFMAAR